MPKKKRSSRENGPRKPVSKSMLLPMPRTSANEVLLGYHVALSACLTGTGTAHLFNELARALYLTFYLQESGYGRLPMDLYKRGEALLEAALTRAEAEGTFEIAQEAAQILGDVLHLHDWQLQSAPAQYLVDAGERLTRFTRSDARSPLPGQAAAYTNSASLAAD